MTIPRRGDLVKNLHESEDFKVDVIYVTQNVQTNLGAKPSDFRE